MKKETMCVRYFFVSLSNWGVGSMASMERSIAAHFVDGTRLYVSDFRVDGSGGNQRVLRFEAALTKPNGAANDRTVGVDASSKPVSLAQPRPLAIKDGKPAKPTSLPANRKQTEKQNRTPSEKVISHFYRKKFARPLKLPNELFWPASAYSSTDRSWLLNTRFLHHSLETPLQR